MTRHCTESTVQAHADTARRSAAHAPVHGCRCSPLVQWTRSALCVSLRSRRRGLRSRGPPPLSHGAIRASRKPVRIASVKLRVVAANESGAAMTFVALVWRSRDVRGASRHSGVTVRSQRGRAEAAALGHPSALLCAVWFTAEHTLTLPGRPDTPRQAPIRLASRRKPS